MIDASGCRFYLEPGFEGLGEVIEARAVILVTEERVAPLWGDAARSALGEKLKRVVVLPAGEENKTLATWQRCAEEILAAEPDRKTAIVALGGGVLGDIAGFAASCVLRGLPLVVCPTTLLSMVDSSVGGKNGVNYRGTKNQIGSFHPPALIWAARCSLRTLPDDEWRCGLGEVVKTAIAAEQVLFELLEGPLGEAICRREEGATMEIVARCVRAKAAVTGDDPKDLGPRLALNAGHTVGHAIEAVIGPSIRHGEAVAIGLVAETRCAVERGICDSSLLVRLESVLKRLGLPTELPQIDAQRLITAMGLDKKAGADKIQVPFPVRPGEISLVALTRAELPSLLPTPLRTVSNVHRTELR